VTDFKGCHDARFLKTPTAIVAILELSNSGPNRGEVLEDAPAFDIEMATVSVFHA